MYSGIKSGDPHQGQDFSLKISRLGLGKGFFNDVMWTVFRQPHEYGWSLHALPIVIDNIGRTALTEQTYTRMNRYTIGTT